LFEKVLFAQRRIKMDFEFRPCPTCREVTIVEVPPCGDDHGLDCPDRACTICATALYFGERLDVRPTKAAA
jgi:hypothetical protein